MAADFRFERHQQRHRGAGPRELKSNFGFSFGLIAAPVQSVPPAPPLARQATSEPVQTESAPEPRRPERKGRPRTAEKGQDPDKIVRKRGRPAKSAIAGGSASARANKSSEAKTSASANVQDARPEDLKSTGKRKRAVKCDEKSLEKPQQEMAARAETSVPPTETKDGVKPKILEAITGESKRPPRRKRPPIIDKRPSDEHMKPDYCLVDATTTGERTERLTSSKTLEDLNTVQEQPMADDHPSVQHEPEPRDKAEDMQHPKALPNVPKRRGRPPKSKAPVPEVAAAEKEAGTLPAIAEALGPSADGSRAVHVPTVMRSKTRPGRRPEAQKRKTNCSRAASQVDTEPPVVFVEDVELEGPKARGEAGIGSRNPLPTKSALQSPYEKPQASAPRTSLEDLEAIEDLPEPEEPSHKHQYGPAEKSQLRRKPNEVVDAGRIVKKKPPALAGPRLKPPLQPRAVLQPVSPNTSPKRQKVKGKATIEDWQKQDWFKASVPSTLAQSSDPRLRFRF